MLHAALILLSLAEEINAYRRARGDADAAMTVEEVAEGFLAVCPGLLHGCIYCMAASIVPIATSHEWDVWWE